jgi:hypothetical protein
VILGAGGLALAWAFAPFVLVALAAARHHRIFLGVAGFYPMDGLQYLAWVRDAQHGLIRNLFGSANDHAVFVHPMWTPSGLLQRVLPFSDAAVLAFWKAISVLVLMGGCARLVAAHLSTQGRRVVALLLAVFGGLSPLAGLMWAFDGGARWDFARAAGDLIPAAALWDYAPLAIALGLMPFAISGAQQLLAGARSRPALARTIAISLLVTWLHPWQGETLIAVYAGLVVWRRLDERAGAPRRPVPWAALGLLIAATALPALYYLLLSRLDAAWAVSEHNSISAATIPAAVLLTCVVPLILTGLAAARRALSDPHARVLVLWIAATLLTVALSRSGEYRAIDGLTIPVAVLAVRVWPESRRLRRLAVPVVLGALAPAAAYGAIALPQLFGDGDRQYMQLVPSEVRAARIAARAAGHAPILTTIYLGTAIPALTDVSSWVGHPIWTPDPQSRELQAGLLLSGLLGRAQAAQLIAVSGAGALIQPCGWPGNLAPQLAPLGFVEVRVGCARLFLRRVHRPGV